jgi:hypothetical protein
MLAVIMPVAINVATATKDLYDSLGNPQTPCPLVQPFPSLVPTPTRNPAIPAATKPI